MTQLLSCIDTPISWFLLDKCLSGELEALEEKRVEHHLENCHACLASWDEVQTTTRELRPLVVPESESLAERLRRWLWPAALVPALAMLVLFVVIGRQQTSELGTSQGQGGVVKGGNSAFSLLREHHGDVTADPTVYMSGDRFRMLVSCAPPQSPAWDVVVYQDDEAYFPFAANQTIECGNEVAIPGAFRITGSSPVTVCLLMGESPPTRDWLATSSPEDLSDNVVCQQVSPVGP